jgi:cation:H+ antiporter
MPPGAARHPSRAGARRGFSRGVNLFAAGSSAKIGRGLDARRPVSVGKVEGSRARKAGETTLTSAGQAGYSERVFGENVRRGYAAAPSAALSDGKTVDLTALLLLAAGLALLTLGGELLVRGASRLAAAFGISPLVIGLTVVAFGTSSPELAVSIQAGLAGSSDIAVGNVVGSNIFNVLLILGACALIGPLIVQRQLIRLEVPIMIGVSLLLLVLALDGRIGFFDGLLLTAGIISYVSWSIVRSRRERPVAQDEFVAEYGEQNLSPRQGSAETVRNLALVVGGLITLVIGARWLVDGATSIARAFGVDDVIIGLTIVAAGTSLPEVATSIIATIRKERDIAIGNVVGSNIFNMLCILGISALVTPGGVVVAPTIITFDLPIMIAVAVACLPIFFTGYTIARWEGALFLGSYIAYTAFLVLVATSNPALETFTNAMLLVLPLIAATLIWTSVQALRAGRGAAPEGQRPRESA